MALGDIALGDGDEAGEPCLGRQQIVDRRCRGGPGPRHRATDTRSRRSGAAGRRGTRSSCSRPERGRDPPARRVDVRGCAVRLDSLSFIAASTSADHQSCLGQAVSPLPFARTVRGALSAVVQLRTPARRQQRVRRSSPNPRARWTARSPRCPGDAYPSGAVLRRFAQPCDGRGQPGGIGQSGAKLRLQAGARGRELPQTLGQRQQRTGEVAAVDGGHVARSQRGQGAGVVPVEQMSLEPLQPFRRTSSASSFAISSRVRM